MFATLNECGYSSEKEQVKRWYDGFIFGKRKDIYNPWSILNFLDTGKYTTHWANTISNSLVGKHIREGSRRIKERFEVLPQEKSISHPLTSRLCIISWMTMRRQSGVCFFERLSLGAAHEREDILEDGSGVRARTD